MQPRLIFLAVLAVGTSPIAAVAQVAPNDKPILQLDSEGHSAIVYQVLFRPRPAGLEVISISFDKTVRIWDAASGKTLRTLHLPCDEGSEGKLYAGALSPDGNTLAVAGDNKPDRQWGRIYLVDLETS